VQRKIKTTAQQALIQRFAITQNDHEGGETNPRYCGSKIIVTISADLLKDVATVSVLDCHWNDQKYVLGRA
jgi:hypothetical protein